MWVGSSFADMPAFLHILLAILAACAAGAFWAGIAGVLKATTGAHEVISTIMLNWIAIWIGVWLFCARRPAPDRARAGRSRCPTDVVEGAKLPVFWGDPVLQGLHIGIFIALAAVVVFWLILNRSTTGYEVRAVGFNPEAARYSGMSVGKNYILVMAVCGVFAGLAGVDGRARLAVPDRDERHPDPAASASSASPSRCSGATRRSGRSRPGSCSAR